MEYGQDGGKTQKIQGQNRSAMIPNRIHGGGGGIRQGCRNTAP
jgi:hypothetical protein